MDPSESRELWHLIEPVHALTYFAPSCRRAHKDLGFEGFWMGYFATRSAPLGPVGPGAVTACFAGFEAAMVQRALPEAWDRCSAADAVRGRAAAAAVALREAHGPDTDGLEDAAETAAAVLDRVVEAADPCGRTLFGANSDVVPFEDPLADLWQLCTSMREHRGDGHVAALVAEGLGGCEPHVLAAAATGEDPTLRREARGWSDVDWKEAVDTLTAAGLLAEGALTERGAALHRHVEQRTDDLAAAPYASVSAAERDELRRALEPIARCVLDTGWIIFPNPMGLPGPR